jgi:hypothetical protein
MEVATTLFWSEKELITKFGMEKKQEQQHQNLCNSSSCPQIKTSHVST